MYVLQLQQCVCGGVEVDQDMGRYYYICMSHNSSNGWGVEVDQNMDMYCLMTSMMGEVVH